MQNKRSILAFSALFLGAAAFGAKETPVPPGTALPGKPAAYGLVFSTKDGRAVWILAAIAPGSPKLRATYWQKHDGSDKMPLILNRESECTTTGTRWFCPYFSDDGSVEMKVMYVLSAAAYKIISVVWDGEPIPDEDVVFLDPNHMPGL